MALVVGCTTCGWYRFIKSLGKPILRGYTIRIGYVIASSKKARPSCDSSMCRSPFHTSITSLTRPKKTWGSNMRRISARVIPNRSGLYAIKTTVNCVSAHSVVGGIAHVGHTVTLLLSDAVFGWWWWWYDCMAWMIPKAGKLATVSL